MTTPYKIDTPEMRFAIQFVLAAGKTIRDAFTFDVTVDWKHNDTPITQADIAINARFIAEASKQFKGYSILGEEASQPLPGAEWAWVIDPIDGTGPLIQGIPLSTCCVSLLHNGIPELGVIYDPMLDRLFYAQKGHGAFMNGQKISLSPATSFDRSFVHMDSLKTGNRKLMPLREKLIEKGSVPMLINAIQYGAALVCAGRGAGVVFSLPNFWDVAAPYIIGVEAGGVATDLYGNQQRYDEPIKGFILANPTLHKELVGMVADCLNRN